MVLLFAPPPEEHDAPTPPHYRIVEAGERPEPEAEAAGTAAAVAPEQLAASREDAQPEPEDEQAEPEDEQEDEEEVAAEELAADGERAKMDASANSRRLWRKTRLAMRMIVGLPIAVGVPLSPSELEAAADTVVAEALPLHPRSLPVPSAADEVEAEEEAALRAECAELRGLVSRLGKQVVGLQAELQAQSARADQLQARLDAAAAGPPGAAEGEEQGPVPPEIIEAAAAAAVETVRDRLVSSPGVTIVAMLLCVLMRRGVTGARLG